MIELPKRKKKIVEPTPKPVEEEPQLEKVVEEKKKTAKIYEGPIRYPSTPLDALVESKQCEKETPKKTEKPSDTVKVKVVFGSVGFEGEHYEVGDVFKTSRKKAASIHQKFVEILE